MTETEGRRARNVAVCTPVSRQVDADFARSMISICSSLKGQANVRFYTVVGHANLPRARNILAGAALRNGADDVVFIDSDIGFEPKAFEKLFSVPPEARIVAGCPQRRNCDEISFCGSPDSKLKWDLTEDRALLSGYAATAFLRVSRSVFDELSDKVEEFDYQDEKYRAFFNYKIGENAFNKQRGFIGEDYYFCMLAKENGIEVWLDPTIELRHWNSSPMEETMINYVSIREPEKEE